MSRTVAGATFALAIIIFGASYALFGPDSPRGPIMTCDPAALKIGATESDIIALCGPPRKVTRRGGEWYPLRGDTKLIAQERATATMHYGDVFDDDRHVNLYLRGNALESVQIFGDYK